MSTNPPAGASATGRPVACQFRADWNASSAQNPPGPVISAKKDALGWAYRKKDNWAYVELAVKNGPAGWVPLQVIQTGMQKRDKIPLVVPRVDPNVVTDSSEDATDCLRKTLEDIWKTLFASKDALLEPIAHTDTDTVKKVVFGQYTHLIPTAFYNSLIPEVKNAMKSGNFRPRDLISVVTAVNNRDHTGVAGCYLWIYGNIQDTKLKSILHNQNIQDAVYPGQSTDLAGRRDRHERFLKGELPTSSNHYRIGKGAQRREMIPVLYTNATDKATKTLIQGIGLAAFLDVMELTLVCLFRSWYPILSHDDQAHPLSREIGAGNLREIQYARLLNDIVDKVRLRTGWRPEQTIGLNWLTPVFSQINADRIIMYWYDPEEKAYIFRTRRPLVASDDPNHKGGFLLRLSKDVRLVVPKDDIQAGKLKKGQEVHLQFKIGYNRETGEYIPVTAPLIRMPAITANDEYTKLRCLSVQVQWVDAETAQWKGCVIQRSQMLIWDSANSLLSGITFGMRLWVLLTRTFYLNRPAWLPDPAGVGRYQVKEVFYDHLRQEYRLRLAPNHSIPWPQDHSDFRRRQIQANLVMPLDRYYVPGNPPIHIGARPASFPSKRVNCDVCLSFNDTSKCKLVGDGSLCEACQKFGLPQCTWIGAHETNTTAADWLSSEGKLSVLGVPTFLPRYTNDRVVTLTSAPYDAAAEDSAAQEFNMRI